MRHVLKMLDRPTPTPPINNPSANERMIKPLSVVSNPNVSSSKIFRQIPNESKIIARVIFPPLVVIYAERSEDLGRLTSVHHSGGKDKASIAIKPARFNVPTV